MLPSCGWQPAAAMMAAAATAEGTHGPGPEQPRHRRFPFLRLLGR